LAHAIASECRVSFLKIAATEIVSGMSGESEEKIRTIFKQAIVCKVAANKYLQVIN